MKEGSLKKLDGIDNLIIDFGVVLCDVRMQNCIDSFAEIGFANASDFLTDHLQSGIFGGIDSGEITTAQFCDEIRKLCANPALEDSEIEEIWRSIVLGVPDYKFEMLDALGEKYRLFLLSNTNECIWKYVAKNYGLGRKRTPDYFEKVFLSYEMKVMKPDPKIMQMLLDDTGIDPARSMLIDDAAVNCRMAESFGMRAYAPKAREDWRHLFM